MYFFLTYELQKIIGKESHGRIEDLAFHLAFLSLSFFFLSFYLCLFITSIGLGVLHIKLL